MVTNSTLTAVQAAKTVLMVGDGSGVVVAGGAGKPTTILTNEHVVGRIPPGGTIDVTGPDGKVYKGRVTHPTDSKYDIATVVVDAGIQGVVPARVGTTLPASGTTVSAWGYPGNDDIDGPRTLTEIKTTVAASGDILASSQQQRFGALTSSVNSQSSIQKGMSGGGVLFVAADGVPVLTLLNARHAYPLWGNGTFSIPKKDDTKGLFPIDIVPSDGTNIVVKEEKYNAFVDVEAALKAALPSGLQSQVTFQDNSAADLNLGGSSPTSVDTTGNRSLGNELSVLTPNIIGTVGTEGGQNSDQNPRKSFITLAVMLVSAIAGMAGNNDGSGSIASAGLTDTTNFLAAFTGSSV
ncbi:MAG: serine protease [Holosporales bacterium]